MTATWPPAPVSNLREWGDGPLPLAGVRVIECDSGIAGAFAGRLLALYGARVLRIEPPAGDALGRLGPFAGDRPAGPGGWYRFLNSGKHSVSLDLGTATGRRLLTALLGQADTLIEEWSSVERGALGPLSRSFPKLAIISITPTGITASGQLPAVAPDLLLQAAGGWMYAMGEPDRAPLSAAGPAAPIVAGLYAAIATLAAVQQQRGGAFELSNLEAVTTTLIYDMVGYGYSGVVRGRAGRRYTSGQVLITTLPCKDGYVGLHAAVQWQWRALCGWVGRPELAADPRFQTPAARAANAEALDAILLPFFAERTAMELYHEGQSRRIPVSLIPSPDQVLASPQLAARSFWSTLAFDDQRVVQAPGAPYRFDGAAPSPGPPPRPGADTVEVLATLGIGGRAPAILRAGGVI